MAHIEQAGGGAGMQMLLQDPGRILDRHLIAGERHHAGPARQMQRMERRARQSGWAGSVVSVIANLRRWLVAPEGTQTPQAVSCTSVLLA